MKKQFLSTESLRIRLTPFIDKVTGSYIVTGADTVTLTIERPDGALHTGGTVSAVFDSITKLWTFDIVSGSFMVGEWRVMAVSSAPNTLQKWIILYWGDYVDSIPAGATSAAAASSTATTINTKLGTPAGVSVSADIAAAMTRLGTPAGASVSADIATVNARIGAPTGASISADIAAIAGSFSGVTTAVGAVNTKLGTPAGATVSADIAAVKADTVLALTRIGSPVGASLAADVANVRNDTTVLMKVGTGRWKVQGTQLIIYDTDDVTPIFVYNLLDDAGLPSGIRVFERVPTP